MKYALPAWVAVTVTLPAPVIVNVEPTSVAGPVTPKLTVNPDVAVAVTVSGATPYVTFAGKLDSVIVCAICVTGTGTTALVDPAKFVSPL